MSIIHTDQFQVEFSSIQQRTSLPGRTSRETIVMNLLKLLSTTALLILMVNRAGFSQGNPLDINSVSLEIKTAILNKDSSTLSKHLLKETYFIDDPYSAEELLELFKAKNSWLQRNLFTGNDSVKHYLEMAADLKVVIVHNDSEDVISYQSSNYPSHVWPWCSVMIVNGEWFFSDMFAYR